MPAFLLASVCNPSEPARPPRRTSALELADMPHVILEGLSGKHGGELVHSKGDSSVVLFPSAPHAIECALALQSRFAEYNRGKAVDKKALVRMSVHVRAWRTGSAADAEATVSLSDQELATAASILDAAPVGRVFLSRQAYAQSQGAQLCGFIPLGLEYFPGLAEPIEIYEAIPAVGRARAAPPSSAGPRGTGARRTATLASVSAAAGTFSAAAVPGAPGTAAEDAATPVVGPEAAPAPPAPLMLVAAVVAAVGLFAAKSALATLLSPLDLLNYVFHAAGSAIFATAGEGLLGSIGGPVLLIAAPAAAAASFWARGESLPMHASLFWLGQAFLSLGAPLAIPGRNEPDTFSGSLSIELFDILNALGWKSRGYAVGQALLLLGCALVAFAVVSWAWKRLAAGPRA